MSSVNRPDEPSNVAKIAPVQVELTAGCKDGGDSASKPLTERIGLGLFLLLISPLLVPLTLILMLVSRLGTMWQSHFHRLDFRTQERIRSVGIALACIGAIVALLWFPVADQLYKWERISQERQIWERAELDAANGDTNSLHQLLTNKLAGLQRQIDHPYKSVEVRRLGQNTRYVEVLLSLDEMKELFEESSRMRARLAAIENPQSKMKMPD